MESKDGPRAIFQKYAKLFRIKTTTIYLFPVILGFAAAADGGGDIAGWKIPFVYLAFFCGSFFASSLNFYEDVESDRLHNNMYKGDLHMSDQPFVTGEMGKVETILLFALTALGCAAFSFLVNVPFAIFMIGGIFVVIGVLYSFRWFRFKNRPVLDIATNAAGACLLLVAGWKAVQPSTWPPWGPIVFGFLFSATLYMPSMANDIPFDAAAGFRTSGVVFGMKAILNAMIPLCVLLVPVAIINFVLPISWLFKLFIGLALPGALAFTAWMHILYRPPQIRFNAGQLVYPLAILVIFYFVYGLQLVLR
jgi:4-hydroxybenzoate polyprenyltransferase